MFVWLCGVLDVLLKIMNCHSIVLATAFIFYMVNGRYHLLSLRYECCFPIDTVSVPWSVPECNNLMSCNNLVAAAYLLRLHALISQRAGNSSFKKNMWKNSVQIYDYQHNLGLILLDRKELESKYEQLKASSEDTDTMLKRERAAQQSALAETRKKEENLKKNLCIQKECVSNVRFHLNWPSWCSTISIFLFHI